MASYPAPFPFPAGVVGKFYDVTITQAYADSVFQFLAPSHAAGPYSFGPYLALAPGLSIDATGRIYGTPTTAGSFGASWLEVAQIVDPINPDPFFFFISQDHAIDIIASGNRSYPM